MGEFILSLGVDEWCVSCDGLVACLGDTSHLMNDVAIGSSPPATLSRTNWQLAEDE